MALGWEGPSLTEQTDRPYTPTRESDHCVASIVSLQAAKPLLRYPLLVFRCNWDELLNSAAEALTSSGDWHSSFYSAIPRVLETHRKFGIMLSLLGLAIRHSFLWSHLYPKQEWGSRPTNPVSPTIPKETVLCCAD